MKEPRTTGSQYDASQMNAGEDDTAQYRAGRPLGRDTDTTDLQENAGTDVEATGVNVPQAPLATGQTMDVHPANLAAAKDALAAQLAAERAIAQHGEVANIDPEEFRSVALPPNAATSSDADTAAPDEP